MDQFCLLLDSAGFIAVNGPAAFSRYEVSYDGPRQIGVELY
jgi:hypothetical protein